MKNIKTYTDSLNEAKSQSQGVLNKRLMDAVDDGDLDNVKGLLDRGAEVDARTKSGWTTLHFAAARDRTDIARLFLDRGAEVDARTNLGSTPLHCAAADDQTDAAKLLLDRGAEVDAMDIVGKTPLRRAADEGQVDVARFLIQHGADPFKAFDGPEEIIDFFKGDISWMPEELKVKLKRMQRGKSAFGM